jgi:glycosyltransferase involved in cell wall biosynthesis
MKVAFLLEFLELTGGHIAVVEIANRLEAKGHEVSIIYPRQSALSRRNSLLGRAERFLRVEIPMRMWRQNSDMLSWGEFNGRILAMRNLAEQPDEPFDVVVATAWRTAEAVSSWWNRPRTIYYVQHYEVWNGSDAQVDATWRLPYELVVSSEWLRALAIHKFCRSDAVVVPYGVDSELFHPSRRDSTTNSNPRVGFLYHVEDWKGVSDTLEAVQIVRREHDIDLVAFGAFDNRGDLPPETEFHLRPERSDLPAIYSSLDAFVCGSWSETGPMTVPEAMACGTPIVSTDVGNVRLWTDGGRAAWIAPPRQPRRLARALADALTNPDERHRRAAAGLETIAAFTWDRAADAFAAVVERT